MLQSELYHESLHLTSEYTVGDPILGLKAANAQPRGPTRPAGQAAPDAEPLRPLTGHARDDIVSSSLLGCR
jgi:hypothetical protein